MSPLNVGIFQFAPRLRDVAANGVSIAAAASKASVDILVTPELSLTGYDVRDAVHTLARPISVGGPVTDTGAPSLGSGSVLVGTIGHDSAAVPYNVAALISNETVTHIHRKIYLPTYGMFDEARYFGAGTRVESFDIKGWRIGVLICEDFWHPMLAYLHAMQGVHALFVMAAAPGRGVWSDNEEGGFFNSTEAWLRIARACAQLYGIYIVICNRVGVEGGVTFGGESMVVGPNAELIARAGVAEELLRVELHATKVRQARTPYAHIRDEDVALALREIQRINSL